MEIKINAIELASELAHEMVCAKLQDDDNAIHMEDADGIYYTEEAQDIFNEWYDHYLNKIKGIEMGADVYYYDDWLIYMLDHSDYAPHELMEFEEHYQNLLTFEENMINFIDYKKDN